MKAVILAIIFLQSTHFSFGQKNTFGLATSILWNKSEAKYYQLSTPKYPSGNAVSYGVDLFYTRNMYKGFFVSPGLGYFRQSFGIARPFQFRYPLQPVWFTESYHYNNIYLKGGIGYTKPISRKSTFTSEMNYNYYYSIKQKYIVRKESELWQVDKNSFGIGYSVNAMFGLAQKINDRFSFSIQANLPVHVRWKTDEIFYSNADDHAAQQIAHNKFSIGSTISCFYQF